MRLAGDLFDLLAQRDAGEVAGQAQPRVPPSGCAVDRHAQSGGHHAGQFRGQFGGGTHRDVGVEPGEVGVLVLRAEFDFQPLGAKLHRRDDFRQDAQAKRVGRRDAHHARQR